MSLINPDTLVKMCDVARDMPPGAIVEIGVYKGGSAVKLAEVARDQGRGLWLFDSFAGIVEKTEGLDVHEVGDFNDTDVDEVRRLIPDAHIVVGDARQTLADTETGPIAFAHLDCDQYETYRVCLLELLPRMTRGGTIWMDDPESLAGAYKAAVEVFGDALQKHESGKHYVRC